MMYRLRMNPSTSKWEIQISTFGLFWLTLQEKISGPGTPEYLPRAFQTLDEALDFLAISGLPRLYRSWHSKPSILHSAGEGQS